MWSLVRAVVSVASVEVCLLLILVIIPISITTALDPHEKDPLIKDNHAHPHTTFALVISIFNTIGLAFRIMQIILRVNRLELCGSRWLWSAMPSVRGVSALIAHTASTFGLWYAYVTLRFGREDEVLDAHLSAELLEGIYQMSFVLCGIGYVDTMPSHASQKWVGWSAAIVGSVVIMNALLFGKYFDLEDEPAPPRPSKNSGQPSIGRGYIPVSGGSRR